MRARFISPGGHRTRVLYEGSGEPLLLIHGLGTTAERWQRNIDALGATHAVYAPDLLNSGFTADVAFRGEPPQRAHLAHLRQLIEAMGIGTYSVAGSSYGGLLAALLALDMPKRVKRLIIVGSGSALHPAEKQVDVLKTAYANAKRASDDATLAAYHRRLCNIAFDPATIPDSMAYILLTASALPGRAQATEDLYQSLIKSVGMPAFNSHCRLEQITVPTLIVTGRDDPRASWQFAVEAQKRIPDCHLEIFESCGHAPMLEHPDAFNALVSNFLATVPSPERVWL